jgi:hypothetical protein
VKAIHLPVAIGLGVCAYVGSAPSAHAADPMPAAKSLAPIATASPPEAAPVAVAPAPETAPSKPPAPIAQLAPNSVFAEGLGGAFAYSLNYERVLIKDIAARVGFSYLALGASAETSEGTVGASATYLGFPITASYLGVRSGKHVLELGGGATLISTSGATTIFGKSQSGSGMRAVGETIAGYRMHPVDGAGFNIRLGAMVFFGKGLSLSGGSQFAVLPWPYFSLGGSF